ncbi:MAG TPA: ATP synthase F0 subunit B [Granulicella sp.]
MKHSFWKIVLPAALLGVLFSMPVRVAIAQESPASASQPIGSESSTPEAQSPVKNEDEKDANEAFRKSPAVRSLGAMIGLNPDQSATAFEVTNFLILAIAVGWFLAKALPKTFRGRSSAIQKHLVDARTATEEANARLGSVEARLAKLDGQIAEMRSEAEKHLALDEQRIKTAVEDEKKKITDAAEQEIAAATLQARRTLQQFAAELAIDHAGRQLHINADTDHLLVKEFAQKLSAQGGTN